MRLQMQELWVKDMRNISGIVLLNKDSGLVEYSSVARLRWI